MTGFAKHKFETLDAMRGVAALVVVLFHFRQMLFAGHEQIIHAAHGYLAVDLFFLLSGFVVAHAYDHRLAAGMSFRDFFVTRMIRLLPMIWTGIAIGAAFLVEIGQSSLPHVAVAAVANAALVPFPRRLTANMFPTNGAQWSLFYEIVANLIFAACWAHMSRRVLVFLIGIAAIGLCVCVILYGRLQHGWELTRLPLGFARVTFSFFFGVLLYRTRGSWTGRLPKASSTVVLMLTASSLLVPVPNVLRGVYDLIFVLVMSPVLVMLGSAVSPSQRALPFAIWAATISYPLYAFHQPVRDWTNAFCVRAGIQLPVGACVAMVVCLVGATLLAKIYDQPFRDQLTKAARHVGLLPRESEVGSTEHVLSSR